MAKLLAPNGWEVPINYFFSKPRFRPGYIPYTEIQVEICDDAGNVIPGAKMMADGRVVGIPDEPEA